MVKMFNKHGSVLIFALWTLSLLVIFATYIGLNIRQKISLLSKIEKRTQMRYAAEAGVYQALASLMQDLHRNGQKYTSFGKAYRHNNPDMFQKMEIGQAFSNVMYASKFQSSDVLYGYQDEESKINLNSARKDVLENLFRYTIAENEGEARDMAEAVIDWRELGQTQITGFYSDDYYAGLEYPYSTKDGAFEVLDELKLVKGFDERRFDLIKNYVTIFGNGQINVNTAPSVVLLALGLEEHVVEKFLIVRRGLDGVEATVDDYIFNKTFDIASEMLKFVELEINEIKQLDRLNKEKLIATNSFYFRIQAQGFLTDENDAITATCIYNSRLNKIEYWREK